MRTSNEQRDEDVKQFIREHWGCIEGDEFFNAIDSRHDKKYIIAIEGTFGFQSWKMRRETFGLINDIKKEFLKCIIQIKRRLTIIRSRFF